MTLTRSLHAVQVAFPYLYNNRPRKVQLSVYHYPMVMYIKAEDPDLPAFYFDPLIHPMPSYKTELRTAGLPELSEEEVADFELPEGVDQFLPVRRALMCTVPMHRAWQKPLVHRGAEGQCAREHSQADLVVTELQEERGFDLYSDNTAAGIALLWAPHPFDKRSGRMRRSIDIPLINSWFMEHASQVLPPPPLSKRSVAICQCTLLNSPASMLLCMKSVCEHG